MEIGIDIVSVERIKKIYNEKGETFLKKIFTDSEIEICHSKKNIFECLAGRFAAKEAIKKVLNEEQFLSFKSIEILNTKEGIPVFFSKQQIDKKIKLSISHEKNYAIAVAIIY